MRGLSSASVIISLLACIRAIGASAAPTVPDNGAGTADMPIRLNYVTEVATPLLIINGLPPGTTVQIPSTLTPPTSSSEVPGGSLGGTTATGNGMTLDMMLSGAGTLAGYSRHLILSVAVQEQTAPRVPGAPVQSYNTDLSQMQGQIPPGDPDFDLLRITAGTNFGLPSPGHTTLTQSGANWSVDSFFDITYRIDFVGHPGGPFSGESGSTTGTAHFSVVPEPGTVILSVLGPVALAQRQRRRV